MKKVFKISSLMAILLSVANSSFATTSSTTTSSLSEKIPMIIGAVLILAVLVIGYKMDKSSDGYSAPPKKQKAPKKKKGKEVEEISEKEESEIYSSEANTDVPYETETNEKYEQDVNVDLSGLNEDEEYEEDDVSLFSESQDIESNFNDIDDNLSFDNIKKSQADDFNSTMIFDSNSLNDEINKEDEQYTSETEEENLQGIDNFSGFETANTAEETNIIDEIDQLEDEPAQDEYTYTDAVEGLDEKIDSLDDLDDIEPIVGSSEQTQEPAVDDSKNFINDLKRQEEFEESSFGGFSSVDEVEEETVIPTQNTVSTAHKRYTKKKADVQDTSNTNELPEFGVASEEPAVSAVEEQEDGVEEEPPTRFDNEFLAQMDQMMKKNQEEKTKRTTKTSTKKTTDDKSKKTTKKSSKK